MKDELTPAAKRLIEKTTPTNGFCYYCKGKGTTYEQPYGVEVICFVCHGTGKSKSLGQL